MGASGASIVPSMDLEDENVQVIDLESDLAGKSNKIFPRTPQEQSDYDRQELDYDSAKKLLNFDGLKLIEKPRYLTKRYVSKIL